LSSKSFIYDNKSLDVDTINLASLETCGVVMHLRILLPNSAMHFKGVIISCVTLEVRRLSILLSAESFASALISLTSRIMVTIHYLLLYNRL